MIWRLLTGVAFVANLAELVTGYGTTVFVEVSYCPATYTTSTLATRTTSSAPSSTSSLTPIVLTVMQGFGEQPQYVSADGTMTNDSSLAVDFSINPTGQLEGAGGFISTDGNEASMTFEVSPTPGAISTFFSLVSNDTIARRDDTHASKILVWRNIAFFGGEATFCVFGSILEVVFGGTSPPGCHEVLLGAIPASDVQNPTSSSMTTVPPSSTSTDSAILTDTTTTTYSFVPTSNSPSLSPTREPTSASTTSQTSSLYLSPSSTRAESSSTSTEVNPSTKMTQGAETSSPESASYSSTLTSTSSPTLSDYPAPTTTGIPNCYDRSPFDGTVNNDYLILCDTDLPGYDIQRVSASNIADCIDECNSYIPSSQGPCVAIAFDILAPANPCALKYNISDVFRGADSFSQAAILVNQPYSPEIVFAEPPTSSSSSTSEETSSTMPPPDSTSSPSSVGTTPSPEFTTSPSSIPTTPPASPMTSGTGAAISTSVVTQRPPSPTTTRTTQTSPSMTSSSHNSPATPASSSTTRTSTLPVPTSSPITSSTTSQQPATVATTTMGQQQSSNPPSTFRSPLSSSTSPSAVSSSTSMVVSSVISSTSASQTSPTTGPTFNAPSSSSGPISSTSSIVTTPSTSLAATSLFTTSSPRPITTTLLSSTTSTSATLSYCSATPITTSLCPAYDHQALNVNGDGSCYEVECSTTLQGNILTGNSTTASSLKTCTSFCTLYNVAVPFGCVGVNFLGSLSGNSPNCILMSSVSSTTFGGGIDSARLLYPGYPSINDPDYLGATTTTVAVSTIRSSSSSSATSLVGGSSSGSGGSQTGTSAGGTRTSATSTTSTTTLSPPSCPAAPTASSCPAPSGSPVPYCYNYTNYGNTAPFEVECSTSFTGATMQPLLAFSFEDCVSWCQYANILVPNSCVGMTYQYGTVSQGGSNNCVRYSTLTCASRGNATYGSARLIWSGYPAMTDYGGNFGC